MAVKTFAAIDVGSYELGMKIMQVVSPVFLVAEFFPDKMPSVGSRVDRI